MQYLIPEPFIDEHKRWDIIQAQLEYGSTWNQIRYIVASLYNRETIKNFSPISVTSSRGFLSPVIFVSDIVKLVFSFKKVFGSKSGFAALGTESSLQVVFTWTNDECLAYGATHLS